MAQGVIRVYGAGKSTIARGLDLITLIWML